MKHWSFGVFDFGIEVVGKVGVFREGVKVKVPEYIFGLFEYRIEVIEREVLDNEKHNSVEEKEDKTDSNKRVCVDIEFILVLLINLLVDMITNIYYLVYLFY